MKILDYILIYFIIIILVLTAIYIPEHLPRGIFGGLIALGGAIATRKYRKQNSAALNKNVILFNILLLTLAFLIGMLSGFKKTLFIVCFLAICLIGVGSIIINSVKYK